MSDSHINKGSWENRRKYLFATTAFFMLVISYCLWQNLDTSVAEAAVSMASIGININIGCYVFGATYQDVKGVAT